MQPEIKQDWEKTKEMLEEGNTIPYPVIVDGGFKTTGAVVFVKKIDKRRWLSVLGIVMSFLAVKFLIFGLTQKIVYDNDVNNEKLNHYDFVYETYQENPKIAENSRSDKLAEMLANLKSEPKEEPKKPEQQTHSKPNKPMPVNDYHDTKLANEADLKKTTQTKKTTQKEPAVPSKKAPADKDQKDQQLQDIYDDNVIMTKDDYEDERGTIII